MWEKAKKENEPGKSDVREKKCVVVCECVCPYLSAETDILYDWGRRGVVQIFEERDGVPSTAL